MLRKILIPSVIFLFCLTMLGSLALAGISPSPFTPQINKLNAIQESLNSISTVVEKDLAWPPDPYEPSRNVIGAVNGLMAKDNQLILLNDFLDSVMEEVLGWPPDPIRPALEGVRDAAQGIADKIEAFLGVPPDPIYPEFRNALLVVQGSAQFLSENASEYLDQTIDCGRCREITTQASCEGNPNCYWISDPGFCCDHTPW